MKDQLFFADLILKMVVSVMLFMGLICFLLINPEWLREAVNEKKPGSLIAQKTAGLSSGNNTVWSPPDSLDVPASPEGDLIRYGRDLVSHTAVYLGPHGSVMQITNGMNCQNCHLRGGTRPFGNNYAAVNSTYPKLRARSGTVESVEKRVNDCIERSLNGKKLDEQSREMKAFVSYIKWVGKNVEKNVIPKGAGIMEIKPLSRPADPVKGLLVYQKHCQSCHGKKGKGVREENSGEWKYPPLHGDSSYNMGAGLLRLSRFAGYVKANMPYGIDYKNPVLTDEESWDVAAYINSLPRPSRDLSKDWPDISKKPFDHPFGPFADSFDEKQHKYGPFEPIIQARKK